MTHNQIDYAKLQETKRANQAKETEDIRYHDMSINLGYGQLAEQARANTLNYEVGMANVAQKEQQAAWQHSDTDKANAIRAEEMVLNYRTKVATNVESQRHNVETEKEAVKTRWFNAGARVLDTVARVGLSKAFAG